MTTVVYKDGILAADKRVSEGNHIHGSVRKIFKYKHCLVGFCGDFIEIQKVRDWVRSNFDGPPPELRKDAPVEAIIVYPSGKAHYIQSPDFIPQPIQTKYMAIGSGSVYAKGAMAAGATAKEAVKIAMMFDSLTGNGVDELSYK